MPSVVLAPTDPELQRAWCHFVDHPALREGLQYRSTELYLARTRADDRWIHRFCQELPPSGGLVGTHWLIMATAGWEPAMWEDDNDPQ